MRMTTLINRLLHLSQFILIILKFMNILNWDWFYVMLPMIIGNLVGMFCTFLVGLIETLDDETR